MENIREIEIENALDGTTTKHIIIDRGNGEFTSMPKSVWDAQESAKAEHLNGIDTPPITE
jgi:hypothetical protein